MLISNGRRYLPVEYPGEADFEKAVLELASQLFGPNRFYLDVKRKIGAKGGVKSIPDAYLIDLNGSKPRLYLVENELQSHDPLRHIAVQILQFSLSAEAERMRLKSILVAAIQNLPSTLSACETYVRRFAYRNLDHLVEHLVFEAPFAALVIIDSAGADLQTVLMKRFAFDVEVLELARFENEAGERIYQFEPFLADITQDIAVQGSSVNDPTEFDTVVVPAREDGFREVFLNENRWYEIRMHAGMRPHIKYIAVYQVNPVSAITHIAPVASIQPWKDGGKFVVNFAEPAKEIGPIALQRGGKVNALQNLRYTTRERLQQAKTLDEVWGVPDSARQGHV